MKVGKTPLASIVLLVFAIAGFIIKFFYPAKIAVLSPYLDGGILGAMLVFLLYYANIYITAYLNFKKDEAGLKQ